MGWIKGTAVTLYEKVQTGTDEFNAPIYEEQPVTVENVLITPEGDQDVINDMQLYGKHAEYELSIPKGDTHNWVDATVEFWGHKFKTFGFNHGYIQENVPLSWNAKVKVERYG